MLPLHTFTPRHFESEDSEPQPLSAAAREIGVKSSDASSGRMEYEAPAVVEVRGQVDHSPVAANDGSERGSDIIAAEKGNQSNYPKQNRIAFYMHRRR